MGRQARWSFGALISLAVALSAFHLTYVGLGTAVSDEGNRVTSYSLALILIWWIVADARHARGELPCHDFGFLVGVALPVSLVWYLVWSRGWRGLGMVVFLTVLLNLPWLSAGVARILLYGDA
jgi:hypothetical protein